MHSLDSFIATNLQTALKSSALLPIKIDVEKLPVACKNCRFINFSANNFCTNCGYPVQPDKDKLTIYNFRLSQRKELQKSCFRKIAHARNALYLLAAVCMLGVFYLFSDWKETILKGVVMVFLGVLYAVLARWSVWKPFTALLIGLIIMLTFAAIFVWAEVTSLFNSYGGVYLLVIQVVLIYFLVQGVKGAFRADILEEEFKM